MRKITLTVTGVMIGYAHENETIDDAAGRIFIEGELLGNNGSTRLHLEPGVFTTTNYKISPAKEEDGDQCSKKN